MDQNNRPRSRDKNVLGGSGSVQKRGSGLGTGPVGSANGRAGGRTNNYRPSGGSSGGSYHSGGRGGLGKLIGIAVVAAVVTNSQAPPAIALLHPLHFQIPAASLRIDFLPQKGHIDFTL